MHAPGMGGKPTASHFVMVAMDHVAVVMEGTEITCGRARPEERAQITGLVVTAGASLVMRGCKVAQEVPTLKSQGGLLAKGLALVRNMCTPEGVPQGGPTQVAEAAAAAQAQAADTVDDVLLYVKQGSSATLSDCSLSGGVVYVGEQAKLSATDCNLAASRIRGVYLEGRGAQMQLTGCTVSSPQFAVVRKLYAAARPGCSLWLLL